MAPRKSPAKKNAAPRSEAPRPSPEEKRAAKFVEEVKTLHHWPDVGIKEWKEKFWQDHGVELKPSHLAYRKMAAAIKNAKYQRSVH